MASLPSLLSDCALPRPLLLDLGLGVQALPKALQTEARLCGQSSLRGERAGGPDWMAQQAPEMPSDARAPKFTPDTE